MSFLAHVEWLPCDCGARRHGILRLFPDLGAPPASDGMPAHAWAWCCHIERGEGVVHFRAALTRPPDAARLALYRLVRSLGCARVRWERCEAGQLVVHEFDVPPVRPPASLNQ